MEELIHYVWKHRLLPPGGLRTTSGQDVEVIDPGLHNTDAGPDFFNAKIRIGGTLWVGNVEIHLRSSDWYAHGHERDARYDNVVLHVVREADREVRTLGGTLLPQVVVTVPETVSRHYAELALIDRYPPCYRIIPHLPAITVHGWMSVLETERLERKTEDIQRRVERCAGSWEAAYFMTLARNYGFGINGEAFETWAAALPLAAAAHHRDDIFQIEALFLGQAGLLQPESIPGRYREASQADAYYQRLGAEYQYLARKFALTPIDWHLWRFLRLRPQNFPHIRLSQLARLYCQQTAGLAQLMECATAQEMSRALATGVTPYWETHYTFGAEHKRSSKRLSQQSLRLIMVNTAIPMLFAYGRHRADERLTDRALELLAQLPAEDNHIVKMWRDCGLSVDHAGDSQALIQLKREYCDTKKCLRCRIGYEYLRQK